MSSIYVMPVEIRDGNEPDKTFWLEALRWIWDASEFWDVVHKDLESRGYQVMSLGEARNWHHERNLWADNALIEQTVSNLAKTNQFLWCENKIPLIEQLSNQTYHGGRYDTHSRR